MSRKKAMTINMREVQASVRKPVAQNQKAGAFRDRRRLSRQEDNQKIRREQWE